MTTLARAAERLAERIHGAVHLPGDAAYDEARTSFNGMIDRRPALVVRCATAGDVRLAVECARAADLPIAVRGGGHSVAGQGIGDGALQVDLSLMREVLVDADRRRARVQGGALWDDVDPATQAAGLAVPGGTYGDTGVGGLTLGGGLGWLLGTAGLTCDNLVRAELVTGLGEQSVVDADTDPELLWALRGGGGNFGVVTSFELALHERGPMFGGYLSFAFEHLAHVLGATRELAASAGDELVLMTDINAGAELRGGVHCHVGIAYAGSVAAGERAISPLRAWPVAADSLGPMSYLELQAMNGRLPFGLRHYWKGHFVRGLDEDVISAVVRAAETAESRSDILLEALTGVAARAPSDGAAFGQREAGWNVSALAIWDDPADDDTQIAWARETAAALESSSLTGGGYVNYLPPDETPERTLAAYGPERFRRLAEVKRRTDPENRLRFNLNVPPATAAA